MDQIIELSDQMNASHVRSLRLSRPLPNLAPVNRTLIFYMTDAWSSIVSLLTMETAFCASQPSAEQEGRGGIVLSLFLAAYSKTQTWQTIFRRDGRTEDRLAAEN